MNKLINFFKFLFAISLLICFQSCSNESINNIDDNDNLSDTIILNIPYGSHERQVYDIHLPANRNENTPVVLMIHGGGWKTGQKEDLNHYINLIKAKWNNVAIVNINYRLANNTLNIHHNEIISDIDNVFNQIIYNKTIYHISDNIGVIGESAGGHLAMIYAYKYNNNIKCVGNIYGPSIINDWSWYNSTNLWLGAYTGDILTEYVGESWNPTAYGNISPFWNVNNNSQPIIIFHGNLDPIVPVYQSQWMHNKLNNFGISNEYYEYIAFHGFDNSQSDDVANKLVSFFKTHIE
jgi:acetyl esterase/lipase